jgi:hypothetical protein
MGFARIGAFVPFHGKENRLKAWCVRGGSMGSVY